MNLRSKLSQFWYNIQSLLFPELEEYLGKLPPTHAKLVEILELIHIEEFLPKNQFCLGRPPKDRVPIARGYVAKMVFKFQTTRGFINYLKQDRQLRQICGWDSVRDLPSESKFSRVFQEFAKLSLPEKVHAALINDWYEGEIIGHVVKDSTPIEAREKSVKKGNAKERKREKDRERSRKKRMGVPNRRQRQIEEVDLDKVLDDLPKECDTGMKKSSQGYTKIWKGYKLHSAVDDNCIPIAAILTSASVNDCEVAIPLAKKADQVATNFYDLMDAAYDHPEIKEHSIMLGHVPIIDKCPNNKGKKLEIEAEKKRKRILGFSTAEDSRYKERLPKERFNALYKDFYGGRINYYKGHEKVSCHVMFGVLVVAATGIIKLTL